MKILNIEMKQAFPDFRDSFVVLFKQSPEIMSVAGLVAPVANVLPIQVRLLNTFFYVSSLASPFRSCSNLGDSLFSSLLIKNRRISFNGASFVDAGALPPEFPFGLVNDGSVRVTCGLAETVESAGVSNRVAVSIGELRPGETKLFQPTDVYFIGIMSLPGPIPEPGLLLSTRIISNFKHGLTLPCSPRLGRFAKLNFAEGAAQTARFSRETGAFTVQPSRMS